MTNHTVMRCAHGSVLAACDEPYSSMRTTISGEPGQRMVTTPAVFRQFAAPPILQLCHDLMPPLRNELSHEVNGNDRDGERE